MALHPEPTNISNGLTGMMQYTNTATDGLFGNLVLIMMYVSLFMFLLNKKYSPPECLASAGFFVAILSVFFNLMNIITNQTMYIAFLGFAFPLVWLFFSRAK